MLKSSSDFAAMVRGDHKDAEAYRKYVMGELRCAYLRAKLYLKEIEMIGAALGGMIVQPDDALVMLADAGALDFLIPLEPPWESSDEFGATGSAGSTDAGRAKALLSHKDSE